MEGVLELQKKKHNNEVELVDTMMFSNGLVCPKLNY
jgi:hypothetical protein